MLPRVTACIFGCAPTPFRLEILFLAVASAFSPLAAHIPYAHPQSYFESRVDLSEPERMRIRKHLARVEADLRAYPPAGLTPAQAAARRQRLDDLRAYRERGEFPRNRDYPDSLVPYFIDAQGVACAVGHLVIASGHGAFAEQIRRTQNHAYIREIADPRLSEWAAASGLTLEECARIQPGYGGPITYPYIREMEVSAAGAVWTLAGESCLCSSMYFQSFSLPPGGTWALPFPQSGGKTGLCLDPQGRPLLGLRNGTDAWGMLWEGKSVNLSGGVDASFRDCAWSPDGSVAWVAGHSGLRTYRFSGSTLILSGQPAPRDSMGVVAAGEQFIWGGSHQKVLGGRLQSGDALTPLDREGKASYSVTGLASQGRDGLWAGSNGTLGKIPAEVFSTTDAPVFSREGLLHRRGITGEWTTYTRATAGLPSDTIQALTPADSHSVWIATAAGIFRFTPPSTVSHVRAGFDRPVTDLATDGQGRLYIATWGLGVFRWHAGTTETLGYYTSSSSLFRAGRRTGDEALSRKNSLGEFRSLLGRRTDAQAAPSVYFLPATGR